MSQRFKILLIDHEEYDIEILEYILEKGYIVSSLDDSDDIIKRAKYIRPDIVILNPDMPNLPLKVLCDALKSLQPPSCLLFLSRNDSIDACSDAYDNGADDFLLKPFNPIEIHEKIQILIKNINIRKQLTMASDTARVAMENSFELGTIITFMEEIGASQDFDELCVAFFAAISNFGISATVQIRGGAGALNFRCANNSLDAAVLGKYQGSGKIIEQSNRIIIHHENISALLKNLPSIDSMKYGRLKDHLCIMVNASGARIISLNLQMELAEKREFGIEENLKKAVLIKEEFKQAYLKYQKSADNRASEFGLKIESILFSLSLDYEQEELLLDSMRSLLVELSDSTELQSILDDNLDKLISDMARLLL